MKLSSSQSMFVPREPDQVFALIDDFSSMHKWMERCIRVQKYRRGENAVGDPLRCFYQGITRHGVLSGAIVARSPEESLACVYNGRVTRIGFDIAMRRHGEGTYLTHTVHVESTSVLARLASPFIRRALTRHANGTIAGLRRCLLAPM
ncbi:SRPBCC family protein [Dyella sp. 20L07]|uniref:SRPBCC family protein n=1 Tax=Dyella sp. 20L07 TaxID=3384240 RepID=UPI003D28F107